MFAIKCCNIVILVCNIFPEVVKYCKEYVVSSENPEIIISVSLEELIDEQQLYKKSKPSLGYCEVSLVFRKLSISLIDKDIFFMHSAVVAIDGEGYCFIGKSGAGKTTQASQWLYNFGDRSAIINGDKPFFKFTNSLLYVYSNPWRGSERHGCKMCAPVRAIIEIVQDEMTYIQRIDSKQSFSSVIKQLSFPTDINDPRCFSLVQFAYKICDNIPIYSLHCDISQHAVLTAYDRISSDAHYKIDN